MNPFVLGVLALLNVPATSPAIAESTASPSDEVYVATSSFLESGAWAETSLPPGTGTSARAKREDFSIPTAEDLGDIAPVLDSLAEADPSTEIVCDTAECDALPSDSFLDAPAVPLAVWAETRLTDPEVLKQRAAAAAAAAARRNAIAGRSSSAPAASSSYTNKVSGAASGLTYHDGPGHKFPWGQCTYYVSTQRTITFRGDAKMWLKNGAAAGYKTGAVPVVGSVVVTTESRWGHVGYVEWVSEDQTRFKFSEMNYVGLGVVSRREMSVDDKRVRGFIY